MEILRAYAHEFVQITMNLGTSIQDLVHQEKGDIWSDDDHRSCLMAVLLQLDKLCGSAELSVTQKLTQQIIDQMKLGEDNLGARKYFDNALLCDYLHQLRPRFMDELETKLFFQLPSNKREYFDSPQKHWEEVINRFPDAVTDVEEMARCFALSRYAASVFHSLIVVEHGLIVLGHAIGVNDRKPGWDATSRKLDELVKGGHSMYPPSLAISFSTCEQINQAIQTMKHAWRNKVNHAANKLVVVRSDFASDIAEEIMLATRNFMRRVATDLPQSPVTAPAS